MKEKPLGVQVSSCAETWDRIFALEGTFEFPKALAYVGRTENFIFSFTRSVSLMDLAYLIFSARGYSHETRAFACQLMAVWIDETAGLDPTLRAEALARMVKVIVGEGGFTLITDKQVAHATSNGEAVKKESYRFLGCVDLLCF